MFKVKEGLLIGNKSITGTGPTEVLTAADVGTMAYQNVDSFSISTLTTSSVRLDDTDSGYYLNLQSTSTNTQDRTLTIDVDDGSRTFRTAGNITLANNFTTAGAFPLTLTATASTTVTLPDSGTLYGTKTGSFSSSNLLTSLSDKTGTGVNVFATGPTLTTLTVSSGGAAITGNSSISGTFDVINGLASFKTSGGQNYGVAVHIESTGGVDNPVLAFKNYNGGTPIYGGLSLNDAGGLQFNAGASYIGYGTQKFLIDASGNTTASGNITASPTFIGTSISFNNYTPIADGAGGRAAIYNDNQAGAGFQALIIAGNNSAGTGQRRVRVYDELYVGTQMVLHAGNYATYAANIINGSYANPAWITSLDDSKVLPSMAGNSGRFLINNGSDSYWATDILSLGAGQVKLISDNPGLYLNDSTGGTAKGSCLWQEGDSFFIIPTNNAGTHTLYQSGQYPYYVNFGATYYQHYFAGNVGGPEILSASPSGTTATVAITWNLGNRQYISATNTSTTTITMSWAGCSPGIYQLRYRRASGTGNGGVTWSTGCPASNAWCGSPSAPTYRYVSGADTLFTFFYNGSVIGSANWVGDYTP